MILASSPRCCLWLYFIFTRRVPRKFRNSSRKYSPEYWKEVSGFSGPPRHHVIPQPQPLPRAFLVAEFVFVRDDASKPPLSPLYRGPYWVLQQSETFFFLQIGDKTDSVSVDGLKPVFSSTPVVPVKPPPLQGQPFLVPASVIRSPVPRHPPGKKMSFAPIPAMQLHRNPHPSQRVQQNCAGLFGSVGLGTKSIFISLF